MFRPFRIAIPAGFDARQYVERSWWDYADLFVGDLYRRACMRQDVWEKGDEFHNRHSSILCKYYPRDYNRKMIAPLVGAGVIECDNTWRRGRKSLGYRVALPYRDQTPRFRTMNHQEICRRRDQRIAEISAGSLVIHRDLGRRLCALSGSEPKSNDIVSIPLWMIYWRDLHYSACRQGRLHTPLTRVCREDRHQLRLNGEVIYQVDVSCSQPLILGITLDEIRPVSGYNEYVSSLHQWYDSHHGVDNHHNKHHQCNQWTNDVGEDSGQRQNVAKSYIEACLDGDIYREVFGRDFDDEYQRDWFKVAFLRAIYDKPINSESTDVGKAIMARFPDVWEPIAAMNRRSHGSVARLMQTVESYTVLELAAGRFMERIPTAPLVTIHDSLCTTASYIEAARDCLYWAFDQLAGVRPRLKINSFDDYKRDETAAWRHENTVSYVRF